MPELTLVRATPHDLATVSETILCEEARQWTTGRQLVVAPSRQVARLLIRNVSERSGAVAGLSAGTLNDLATEMLPMPGASARLPDRGSLSLVAELLEREPGPFGARSTSPRVAAAVDRAIAELREAGAETIDVDSLSGELSPEEFRLLGHLSRLLRLFERRLSEAELLDDAARYTRAASSEAEVPAGGLFVHAIYDLTEVQRQLLRRVARESPITWIMPRPAEDSPSRAIVDETAHWAAQAGFVEVEIEGPAEPPDVELVTASGWSAEAVEATREVVRLLGAGADAGRIAIVTADRSNGAARHAEALQRAGIPVVGAPPSILFDVPRARRVFALVALLQDARGTEVLAALGATDAGSRLTAARVAFLYARAGCDETDIDQNPPRMTAHARRLASESKIAGEKSDPLRWSEAVEARLAARRLGWWIRESRAVRERFAGELSSSPGNWVELADALEPLFARLTADAELLARIREALAGLRRMSRAALPFRLDLALEVLEVRLRLGAAVSAAGTGDVAEVPSAAREPRPGEGVLVIDLDRARGLSTSHVLVTGVTHEQVDAGSSDDPLLSDGLRRRLRDLAGLTLRSARRRADESDLLVALAIAAGRQSTRVSWPRSEDESGKSLVPSDTVQTMIDAGAVKCGELPTRPPGFEERGARPLLDANEYDLAVASDPAASRLAAHLSGDQELERRIRAHRARWLDRRVTEFDGVVGPDAVERKLRYVPTTLERIAGCPFEFFLRDHLGLEEPESEDPLGAPDPRELGSIVHEVLEEFYSRVVGVPVESWPDDAQVVRRIAASLKRRIDEHLEGTSRSRPLWEAELRRARGATARFVLFDKRRMAAAGAVVLSVEEAFEEALDLAGASLDVRGRVDRIDRDSSGALHVTDYKYSKGSSSSPTPKRPLQGGTSLQLPLYAMLVAARHDAASGSARIVYLKDGANRREFAIDLEQAAESRGRIAELIARLARFDEDGRFIQRLEDPVCSYCDFDELCGPSKARRARRTEAAPERVSFEALSRDFP